jgi:hypothetical protein
MNSNILNGVTFKYYHGEDVTPFPKEDVKSKFWWGEIIICQ